MEANSFQHWFIDMIILSTILKSFSTSIKSKLDWQIVICDNALVALKMTSDRVIIFNKIILSYFDV